MRFASFDHYGIVTWKIALAGIAAAGVSAAVLQAASGGVLGAGAPELDIVVALLVFYMVVSLPKRLLDASTLAQSREAPSLSVMASIDFEATHSRSRTMLMLMPADPDVSRAVGRIKRTILLGGSVGDAAKESSGVLTSHSAADVLRKAATLPPESVIVGGEESRGILGSLQLGEEAQIPIFMTLCFFTPILLLLYAVFSHLQDPRSLSELVGVQVVVLDVSFHFTSYERGRLG